MHYQLSCCIVKRHYKDNMFFHISNPTLGWSACCWSLISINRLNSRSSEAIGVWICPNAWQKLQMPHIIERTEESLQAFGNAGRSTVRSPGSACFCFAQREGTNPATWIPGYPQARTESGTKKLISHWLSWNDYPPGKRLIIPPFRHIDPTNLELTNCVVKKCSNNRINYQCQLGFAGI